MQAQAAAEGLPHAGLRRGRERRVRRRQREALRRPAPASCAGFQCPHGPDPVGLGLEEATRVRALRRRAAGACRPS